MKTEGNGFSVKKRNPSSQPPDSIVLTKKHADNVTFMQLINSCEHLLSCRQQREETAPHMQRK